MRFRTQGVNIPHYFGCPEEQGRGEVPGSIQKNQWQKKTEIPFSGYWLQVTKQSKWSAWYVNEPQKGSPLPAWSLDLSPVLAHTQSWKGAFPFRNYVIFFWFYLNLCFKTSEPGHLSRCALNSGPWSQQEKQLFFESCKPHLFLCHLSEAGTHTGDILQKFSSSLLSQLSFLHLEEHFPQSLPASKIPLCVFFWLCTSYWGILCSWESQWWVACHSVLSMPRLHLVPAV